MKFDKNELKNSLTIDQIEEILVELGGEPRRYKDALISKTICHGGDSHKLYYYPNTHLFKCYTACDDTWDIFDLIIRVKKQHGEDWSLYNAMSFVADFFSINFEEDFSELRSELQDWNYFNKRSKEKLSLVYENQSVLPNFDNNILLHFPRPHIIPWEREGISKEVCDKRGICYDPISDGVVIPHFDIMGHLVGIRERTLIKEYEDGGKYRPAVINKQMYNHPLSLNLYNINNAAAAARIIKKVIVFESEKSCLKFATYFGQENDISVACCGSNISSFQIQLLLSLGIQEIIIALDRQYQQIAGEEHKEWVKKLYALHKKYGKFVQLSYIFDKNYILKYKNSPIDQGKDIFLELYNKRIFI